MILKVYMIVTNDEYEIPVAMDIVGAQAAADYLGMSLCHLRQLLMGIREWNPKRKYKAVYDEVGTQEELERRRKEYLLYRRAEYSHKSYWKKKEVEYMNLSKYITPKINELRENLNLTDEELQVFNCITKNKSINEIACKLNVSTRTVDNRIKSIKDKIKQLEGSDVDGCTNLGKGLHDD